MAPKIALQALQTLEKKTSMCQKTTKDPEIKGSRSLQRSVTDHPLLSVWELSTTCTPEERGFRTLTTL